MSKGWGPGYTLDDVVHYAGFAVGVVIAGMSVVAYRGGWANTPRDWTLTIACLIGGFIGAVTFNIVWDRLKQPPRPPMGPPPEERPPMR